MESLVRGFDVRVVSRFTTRSRLTARQRRNSVVLTHRTAFSLCIYSNVTPALLDADKCPKTIIISDWHFKAIDNPQSVRSTAIDDVGSNNRNSFDKVFVVANNPAIIMERCGVGNDELAASTSHSAASMILGVLRSIDTVKASIPHSIVPPCTDVVLTGAAGDVRAIHLHTDNVANNN